MKIRILSAQDVESALPMEKAIDVMREAFGQLSAGLVTLPLRGQIATEKGLTFFMPAYLHQTQELAVKLVSVYGENSRLGLPSVTAIVLVLDAQTGLPRALIEGNSLTAIRTGAVGGLAAQLLSRADAKVVALFGAGVQAQAQLQGVMAVRSLEQVNLISRTHASAEKLAAEIYSWSNAPLVNLVSTPQQAIQNADIVITATTSATPVFDGQDLRPGTHVTGVGSYQPQVREVDEVTVRRARIVVDSREACLAEAGDLIIPQAQIDAELGEIVNGLKPERQSDSEITFFKSVGVAVQDTSTAGCIFRKAEERNLGKIIEL